MFFCILPALDEPLFTIAVCSSCKRASVFVFEEPEKCRCGASWR